MTVLKISSMLLKGFKRFKVSGIKEFKLDVDKNIQCIIGTNGSGKSSVLNQLIPNTPIKSDFNKKGIRALDIEYKNENFELTSDFSHSGKAHSFKKDNAELNVGGGANIQQELIESRLDISPVILKIISCDIDICNMTPSKRRQLLLSLNPIDISLFTEYHQSIRKELTKTKNNLSMLYDRKIKLKEQKISNSELSELNRQKDIYQKEKIECTQLIIKIQTILESIPKETQSKSNINFPEIYELIKSYIKLNFGYSDITTLINNNNIKLAQLNETIDNENRNIDKVITEIEEYKNHLKHTTQVKKIEIIDSELSKTISDLKALNKVKNNFKLDIFILRKLFHAKEEILQKIIDWTNIFREYDYKEIISKEEIDKLDRMVETRKNESFILNSEISILDNEIKNLSKEINKSNLFNIPDNCQKDVCSLFQQYDSKFKEVTNRSQKISKECFDKSEILSKNNEELYDLQVSLEMQNKIQLLLFKLNDIINEYPYLKQIINGLNIRDILITEPFILTKTIKEIFDTIEKVLKKESLEENKDNLLKELNALKSSTKVSSEFIETKLKQNEIEYNKRFKSIAKLNKNKLTLESTINTHITFKNISENLFQTKENLQDLVQNIEHDKTKEFYRIFLDEVFRYSTKLDEKLQAINNTIKNQEFIIERLKKEILLPIKTLSKNKVVLGLLEKGLKEISLTYIEDFLNKIIEISNFFLSKIMTYPVILDKIKQDEINFNFPVTINDIEIKDINEVSSGQKDMIKLSFNLALLVILSKNTYPLFIDEIDKALDETHKLRLIDLFNYLLDENIISQLFLINHHVILQEGFDGDVIVLNEDNIATPEVFNTNLIIKK